MRITIIATGSRGDVQPYVALGQGLCRAGHEVCLVTTADFAELATAHGLTVRSVGLDVQAALGDPAVRAAIEGGGRLASFRHMTRLAREAATLLMREGLAAARGTDVLLAGFGGLLVAASLAEALCVPFVRAFNVPVTPTGAFPGALLPGLSLPPRVLRRLTHRLSHWLSWQALWQMARAGANDARREVLGLRGVPRLGPHTLPAARGAPLLYGISPAVLPRPADWDADVHVTGFWFLDEPAGWTPPPALDAFLAAGPAPVYIGFGSMSSTRPEELSRVVLDAVATHGRRAVVSAGWAGLRAAARRDDVLVVDAVPHAWLFPRVSAVVHHGGAGTTAAALRAGVPSVVVPFHGDQPFWGRLVHGMGVGTRPIPRNRLAAPRLAAAIEEALTSAPMRERAAWVGRQVRDENGVAAAVALIGSLSH